MALDKREWLSLRLLINCCSLSQLKRLLVTINYRQLTLVRETFDKVGVPALRSQVKAEAKKAR